MTLFFLNHMQDYSQHPVATTSFLAVMHFAILRQTHVSLMTQSNPHSVASLCKHFQTISPIQPKSQRSYNLTTWILSGLILVMTTHMPWHVRLTIKLTNLKSFRQITNLSI